MKTVKIILLFLSKQVGYIIAIGILFVGTVVLGIYFASTDSNPADAVVITPVFTVPVTFIAGVLLSKLFNRKRKDKK